MIASIDTENGRGETNLTPSVAPWFTATGWSGAKGPVPVHLVDVVH
jgi:hypothetical protein